MSGRCPKPRLFFPVRPIRVIHDKRREQTETFLDDLKRNANYTMDEKALSGVQVVPPGTEGQPADDEEGEMPAGH